MAYDTTPNAARLQLGTTLTVCRIIEAICFQIVMHTTEMIRSPHSPWPTLFHKLKRSMAEDGNTWRHVSNVWWMNTASTKTTKKEAFVVTGATESAKTLNNGVNIPEKLWTAFCCYSDKVKRWLASAHWDDNIRKPNTFMETKTLANLKSSLKVEPFPNTSCPKSSTVSQYYAALNNNCNCPPPPPPPSHKFRGGAQSQYSLYQQLMRWRLLERNKHLQGISTLAPLGPWPENPLASLRC